MHINIHNQNYINLWLNCYCSTPSTPIHSQFNQYKFPVLYDFICCLDNTLVNCESTVRSCPEFSPVYNRNAAIFLILLWVYSTPNLAIFVKLISRTAFLCFKLFFSFIRIVLLYINFLKSVQTYPILMTQ